MAKVTIGGDERTIRPFSAAKAMEAAALITDIVENGTAIFEAMDTYAANHVERTAVKVPRAAAFYRDPERAAQVPADAWEASGNTLDLPGPRPGFEEQLLAVFPQVFRLARGQILKLLALVLVEERELEEADAGGQDAIDEMLTAQGRKLLFKARPEELLSLGQTAWQACQEQLRADPTALALLTRLTSLRSGRQPGEKPSEPRSSTASPSPTRGAAKRSSSGSRGASSKR